jgi:hypothetical protein
MQEMIVDVSFTSFRHFKAHAIIGIKIPVPKRESWSNCPPEMVTEIEALLWCTIEFAPDKPYNTMIARS